MASPKRTPEAQYDVIKQWLGSWERNNVEEYGCFGKKKKDLFLSDNEGRNTQEIQYALKADLFLMEYFSIFAVKYES